MKGKCKGKIKTEEKDAYVTFTPQALIDFCRDCPYPLPICGDKGCEEYKALYQRLVDSKVIRSRGRKRKFVEG